MKKELLAFLAGFSIQFMSCTSPSSNKAVDNNPSQMERNLFAARSIDKAVETGNVSRLGPILRQMLLTTRMYMEMSKA